MGFRSDHTSAGTGLARHHGASAYAGSRRWVPARVSLLSPGVQGRMALPLVLPVASQSYCVDPVSGIVDLATREGLQICPTTDQEKF
jgi:hypothetical protein